MNAPDGKSLKTVGRFSNKRGILGWAAALCLGASVMARGAETVKITVEPEAVAGPIAGDFLGFGYETSAVARPGYFSAKDATLVQLYRTLGPRGLVRIGGNISDHTTYLPDGVPAARPQTETTVINRAELVDLGGFLRATGWKAMWGLNLGTGSKQEAVEEAAAVSAALGPSLQSFEIGNEVDLIPRFKGNFAAYHAAFLDYKAAIRAALPAVSFSGPDVASTTAWAAEFAGTEAADLVLLTEHYYRSGARSPQATIATLLAPDPSWIAKLATLRQAGRERGLAYRINEINSFSGGGKAGVSDTFAEALWALDTLFYSAANRCAGINLETDINQFASVSCYSPIFRDEAGRLSARPAYYGMLAFALAGRGVLLDLKWDRPGFNLTAYATKDSRGSLWLTIVNKDLGRDARVEVPLPAGYSAAGAYRLSAPSVDSRDRVTLGGTEVSADGNWAPGPLERIAVRNAVVELAVPHASAALVNLKRSPGGTP